MKKTVTFFFTSILLILALNNVVFAKENTPSLLFEPSQATAKVNESFTIDIIIDTAGQQVAGVGAEFFYPKSRVEITKIDTYPIFDSYPNVTYDNTQGIASISGIKEPSSKLLYQGRDKVATVTFQAKTVGKETINFNFLPNNTRDSNIAVSTGNGDILAYTNNLNITINPKSTTVPSTATTTVTPDQNTTPKSNSFFYPIIIGLTFLALIIILILVVLKRKMSKPNNPIVITKYNNDYSNNSNLPNNSSPSQFSNPDSSTSSQSNLRN